MNISIAINAALIVWAVASLVFLLAVEGFAAIRGLPTISERMHMLQTRGGVVFILWGIFTLGLLAGHFWGGVAS